MGDSSQTQGTGRNSPFNLRVVAGFTVAAVGFAVIALTEFPGAYIGVLLVGGGLFIAMRYSNHDRRTTLAFSAFLIIGAGAIGLRQMLRYDMLNEHPVNAVAVVLDTGHYSSKVKGGQRWVEYSYTVNGVTYTAREYAAGHAPGDSIRIRYAADDPSISLPAEPELMP